jgi:hypothetical protein
LRLDPSRSRLEVLDPERQMVLVRLEEALKAYDRGADINALGLWVVAQMRDTVLTSEQKKLLSSELLSALDARRKTGVPEAHIERIRRVLANKS